MIYFLKKEKQDIYEKWHYIITCFPYPSHLPNTTEGYKCKLHYFLEILFL